MDRTKKAISEAFWQLLEEKPYNKITVQSIVERCHIVQSYIENLIDFCRKICLAYDGSFQKAVQKLAALTV